MFEAMVCEQQMIQGDVCAQEMFQANVCVLTARQMFVQNKCLVCRKGNSSGGAQFLSQAHLTR